jgi:GNAT superfamily N-acetyltransferase
MLNFRKATANDSVTSMLYGSSKDLVEYVFHFEGKSIEDFLTYDFKRGKGIFGFRSLLVAESKDGIVGILTAYPGSTYNKLVLSTVASCFKFFGFWKTLIIVKRSIALAPLFLNPSKECVYIANGFVEPTFRQPGVFSSLVNAAEEMALLKKLKYVECDVSYKNERSLKVHQSMGFQVIHEANYRGENPLLDGVRRLRLEL